MICRFEDIIRCLEGGWICKIDGKVVDNKGRADWDEYKNYIVLSVSAKDNNVVLEIKPWESLKVKDCSDEEWYKQRINQFGKTADFF